MYKKTHSILSIVANKNFGIFFCTLISHLACHGDKFGKGLLKWQTNHCSTLLFATKSKTQSLYRLLHSSYDEALGISHSAVEI